MKLILADDNGVHLELEDLDYDLRPGGFGRHDLVGRLNEWLDRHVDDGFGTPACEGP